MDEAEAGWPPVFPPLLSGREVPPDADPLTVAAREAAGGADPGTIAFAGPGNRLRFAIGLAPEVPLGRAVQMGHALMIAAGDSIGALAPPEVAVHYRWPTAILINRAVAGRVRLAASSPYADAVPDWLVVGIDLNLGDDGVVEPGERPDETTLYEEGAGAIPPVRLLESLSRHFLSWLHRWETEGFRPLHEAWSARAERGMKVGSAAFLGLDEDGRALLKERRGARAGSLVEHLEAVGP